VHKEGQMQGVDLQLVEDVVERATVPVYASGGVGNVQDLRNLADRGAAARWSGWRSTPARSTRASWPTSSAGRRRTTRERHA
jgi:hypothetical protein